MRDPRVRAMVAEDEPDQRRLLVQMLRSGGRIDVVAQAADGDEAVDAILRDKPDVAFLDVRMPELDAFGVIETVGVERMPLTVFVTAYDSYAVKAFEVHALDYVLKPYDAERLAHTVERVEQRSRGGPSAQHGDLAALVAEIRRESASSARVTLRVGDRVVFMDAARIERIEADGRTVVVHAGTARLKVRESISAIANRLDPAQFVRVHRSAIVNARHIQEMQPWFKGAHVIVLRSGTRVTTGPSYVEAVRRLIG